MAQMIRPSFLPLYDVRLEVDMKPADRLRVGELGRQRQPMLRELLPTVARQISKHKKLPCVMFGSALWIITQPFKDVIEKLEPNVHQFFGVTINRDSIQQESERCFYFFCRQWIDAIVEEESNLLVTYTEPRVTGGVTHPPVRTLSKSGSDKNLRLVLRREKILGRHLWQGDTQLQSTYFASDALGDAMRIGKLRGVDMYYCQEL
jgi:hypothetical protein